MPREPRLPRYQFQVGEIVRCIHPDRTWLTRGGLYQIKETMRTPHRLSSDQLVGLHLWPGILWGAWRFKRVKLASE